MAGPSGEDARLADQWVRVLPRYAFKDARALGETEQRLFVLDAWEEAAIYSERERAALALTDAVTRITEGHVADAVFERARAHFNEQELIALVFTLTTINAWNRLAITMRTEVGNYQPKARPVSQSGMQRRVRT
jgi:alkylhydroperoxidase family enzyme